MSDDKIAPRALLETGSDATFLREMIGFAADRLMQLEAGALRGAAPGERTPNPSYSPGRWAVANLVAGMTDCSAICR